jgi:flagellar biogenesis protein FliO
MGSDAAFTFLVVGVALVVMGTSIWGIVRLAKGFSRQTTGMQLVYVLAIGALSMLVLAGIASAGCVAMLSKAHF